jgi:aryl-alcohol dehydrogenase-like predicted oxidoreductase
VVLATKVWFPMGTDTNRRGASRRWIVREVEDSLRRLGTDWIDLYQIHRYQPDTDIEETLGALSDLVHQGKVRYIGSSTFPASAIVEAQWAARDRHLQRFVCEQPPYSILVRGIEAEVLPTCARYGMGAICWSPLAGGWLSGRYRRSSDPAPWSSWKASSRPPTSSWRRRCWTASTRSSRPASTSTPPTAAGRTRPCNQPHDGARGTWAAEDGPASDRLHSEAVWRFRRRGGAVGAAVGVGAGGHPSQHGLGVAVRLSQS